MWDSMIGREKGEGVVDLVDVGGDWEGDGVWEGGVGVGENGVMGGVGEKCREGGVGEDVEVVVGWGWVGGDGVGGGVEGGVGVVDG